MACKDGSDQCLCVVSTVSTVKPSFSACCSTVSGSAGSTAAALPDLLASLFAEKKISIN